MASNANYDGCVYQIDSAFMKEWGIDFEAYTGTAESATSSSLKFDYRYNTKKMYGFCVPDFDASSGASALSDQAIKTFKRLF
jgi:hypothetical protein